MLTNSHALGVMCLGLTLHPIKRKGGGGKLCCIPHNLKLRTVKCCQQHHLDGMDNCIYPTASVDVVNLPTPTTILSF